MIKFVHTADTHFGIENYGKIDQKTGIHSRLLDFNKAFKFCVDTAIEKNVDFFLFCGDAYKTIHPTPTQQKFFMQNLLQLHKAKIPIVLIVGNHDHPLSFGKATSLEVFGDLPLDGFHFVSKPQILTLKTKSGPIQIVGISWPTRNSIAVSSKHLDKTATEITTYISKAVGDIISNLADKLDPKLPAVLAGHLTISSGVFSGSEKRAIYGADPVLLPSQLAIKPFDYVALGHLHRHQNLNKNGIPIIYSGSVERIDFGERNEDKGFCIVSIESNKTTSYEFIKTPTRPFVQIEVKIGKDKNQTESILNEIKKHKINEAIVKIIYHVPEGKKDSVDLIKIQKACLTAWHIVGIIPIIKATTRTKRMSVSSHTPLEELLETYFSAKTELNDSKSELIKKSLALYEQAREQEENV
ncbi:exonuclease SbcCD subunit D [bacterium]|jgi:DNA repair protein SbcD/Mre11|nr:exonuclease SbcCD subunit D [bacterium]